MRRVAGSARTRSVSGSSPDAWARRCRSVAPSGPAGWSRSRVPSSTATSVVQATSSLVTEASSKRSSTGPADSSTPVGPTEAAATRPTASWSISAARLIAATLVRCRVTSVTVPSPYQPDAAGRRVRRSFAFVDLSGFTALTDQEGDERAVDVLTQFRNAVRGVAGFNGVRVAKWLGDGAMIVSIETEPLVEAVIEIQRRLGADASVLPLRAGLAADDVI